MSGELRLLEGRVAIVTGATRGIGRVIATTFARNGAAVAILGRDEKAGREVEAEVAAAGGRARFCRCDVTDVPLVGAAVAATKREFGPPTILVNNAAPMALVNEGRERPLHESDDGSWDALMAVGLQGQVHVLRAVLPEMRAAGGGSIVNVSSIASVLGRAGLPAYTTFKAALNGLSRQLAIEYRADGIRSNALIVGPTVHEGVRAEEMGYDPRDPRLATPDAVADVALFLASDLARHVTGVLLPVDGGRSAELAPPGTWSDG